MDQCAGNSGDLQCNVCNRYFSSAKSLMEHSRLHTGERPYTCSICHKCFTQKGHLNIHKRTHTGEKPYACHICHKRFSQSSHLNTHKRIHTGEKPYYCNFCKIGFSRKQRLEMHILQHIQDGTCPSDFSLRDIADDATMSFPEVSDTKIANITTKTETFPEHSDMASPSVLSPPRRRKPVFVTRVSTEEEEIGSFKDGDDLEEATGLESDNILCNIKKEQTSVSERPQSHMLSVFLENTVDDEGLKKSTVGTESEETRKMADDSEIVTCVATSSDIQNNGSGDENDAVSVTSESNHSSSDVSVPVYSAKRSMLSYSSLGRRCHRQAVGPSHTSTRHTQPESAMVRTNNRICLVDFTTEDLLMHLMSRDDVYRCDFCCIIFRDAAMYHLHRSMHEKMDIRSCNLCGKTSQDKYDFTAHFLSEHK